MTLGTRRFLVFVGVIVAGVALLFHYQERDSYQCQTCFARRHEFQWRFGSWQGTSIPLTPSWQRITETHLRQDFFPNTHAHTWVFRQGSPYHFFGTTWGGCALGVSRHVNTSFKLYESAPEFREFIQEKLRNGSLTKSNLISILSSGSAAQESALEQDSEALVRAFMAR